MTKVVLDTNLLFAALRSRNSHFCKKVKDSNEYSNSRHRQSKKSH